MSNTRDEFVCDCLEIQAYAKLILTRPNREKFEFYKKEIIALAFSITKHEFDTLYVDAPQTEISLAVNGEKIENTETREGNS